MGRMRRALQQRLPVAAGTATLTVFLAAVILLPKTTSEVLRDSAFDIELAEPQCLSFRDGSNTVHAGGAF